MAFFRNTLCLRQLHLIARSVPEEMDTVGPLIPALALNASIQVLHVMFEQEKGFHRSSYFLQDADMLSDKLKDDLFGLVRFNFTLKDVQFFPKIRDGRVWSQLWHYLSLNEAGRDVWQQWAEAILERQNDLMVSLFSCGRAVHIFRGVPGVKLNPPTSASTPSELFSTTTRFFLNSEYFHQPYPVRHAC